MTYCIVTGYYELKTNKRRSITQYMEHISYLYGMGIEIIFFTNIADRIRSIYPNIHYISIEMEDLPIHDKIMNSELIPVPFAFDSTTKEYSIITISKMYFINEAKKYTVHDHYVWIDSGITCHGSIGYDEFKSGLESKLVQDKITLVQMRCSKSHERVGDYLLSRNLGIIAGGIIAVPKHLTQFLWNETLDALSIMIDRQYLCLDEQVLAYINGKHIDMFNYWFSDYGVAPNLKYTRREHDTIVNNLIGCVNENRENGCEIARVLLDSIEFLFDFPKQLVPTILYNTHLLSYYVQHETYKGIPLHLLTAKVIHYMIHVYNVEFPSNVIDNIRYSGIDVDQVPELTDDIAPYIRSVNH